MAWNWNSFIADPVHQLTGWGPMINPWTEPVGQSQFSQSAMPVAGGIVSSLFGLGPAPGAAAGQGLASAFNDESEEETAKKTALAAGLGYVGGELTGTNPSGISLSGGGGGGTTLGGPGAGYSQETGSVASGQEWGMGPGGGGGTNVPNTGKSSSILGGMDNKAMLGLMAGGMALDYYGQKQSIDAQNKALEQYRADTSWTPERTSSYMNALNLIGQGVYGSEEEKKKKSVAEMLAGAGRGGGAFGGNAEKIARERRELVAKLLAGGALETSKPPNYPFGSYSTASAEGQALQNIGGTTGKYLTAAQQMAMLQALYGNRGATT